MSKQDPTYLFHEEGSSVRKYFVDIENSRPLSKEREVELSAQIQQGNLSARDELVNANLRFVVEVAKKYRNRGIPFLDLISSGNMGLMTAAERFDGTKGFKFISYAVWWIKQAILQTIAEHARTVRLPLNRLGVIHDVLKASEKLKKRSQFAFDPTPKEIAEEMEVSEEEVVDALTVSQPTTSLDDYFVDDEVRSLLDVLPDTHQQSPDEVMNQNDLQKDIEKASKCLDDREHYIINRYYGLNKEKPLTLEEIGALLGITRERVRQIREKALQKLRHPRNAALWKLIKDSH